MAIVNRFLRFWNRRESYRRCFVSADGKLTRHGEAVLADLASFCRANRPTVVFASPQRVVDTHASMLAEGRREVYCRIIEILGMTDAQLNQLKEEAPE